MPTFGDRHRQYPRFAATLRNENRLVRRSDADFQCAGLRRRQYPSQNTPWRRDDTAVILIPPPASAFQASETTAGIPVCSKRWVAGLSGTSWENEIESDRVLLPQDDHVIAESGFVKS